MDTNESAVKQLKKTDFLNAVPTEAVNLEDVTTALTGEGFEFLPSYADYLLEHFIEAGRVVRNEDGTIQRSAGGSSSKASERDVYQVRVNDGNYKLVKASMRGNPNGDTIYNDETGEVAAFGWAITPNAAIKKATQHVFAIYKDQSTAVKALADGEPTDVDYDTPVIESDELATEYTDEELAIVEGDDADEI